MSTDIPEGFKPLKRGGGYLTSLGPWYYRLDEKQQMVLAIRIEDRHTNIRHIAHGGFLVTMVDSALGVVVSSSREPAQPIVTVSPPPTSSPVPSPATGSRPMSTSTASAAAWPMPVAGC